MGDRRISVGLGGGLHRRKGRLGDLLPLWSGLGSTGLARRIWAAAGTRSPSRSRRRAMRSGRTREGRARSDVWSCSSLRWGSCRNSERSCRLATCGKPRDGGPGPPAEERNPPPPDRRGGIVPCGRAGVRSSVRVGAKDLAEIPGAEGPVSVDVDRVLDPLHGPVGHSEVGPAGVPAPEAELPEEDARTVRRVAVGEPVGRVVDAGEASAVDGARRVRRGIELGMT